MQKSFRFPSPGRAHFGGAHMTASNASLFSLFYNLLPPEEDSLLPRGKLSQSVRRKREEALHERDTFAAGGRPVSSIFSKNPFGHVGGSFPFMKQQKLS